MYARKRGLWIGAVGVIALVVACGKSGTNQVTGVVNGAPIVSGTITMTPPEGGVMVAWGGTAKLTVQARDPEGGTLTYTWTAASGSVVGPNAAETTYRHNAVQRDSDTVTVTITDGAGGSVTATVIIRIGSAPAETGNAPPNTGGENTPTPRPTPTPPPPPPPDDGGGSTPAPTTAPPPPTPTPAGPTPTPVPGATATPIPTATPTPIPAPTISISGGGSCHPNCSVNFSAAGSNFTSLSWGGCCSGSGSSSSCSVTGLGAHTCTVTATGPGGTSSDQRNATGTNNAPTANQNLSCAGAFSNTETVSFSDPDGDNVTCVGGINGASPSGDPCRGGCDPASGSSGSFSCLASFPATGPTSQHCEAAYTCTDSFGASIDGIGACIN